MQLIWNEARKQRAFREVWVGYLLAALLLSVFLYADSGDLTAHLTVDLAVDLKISWYLIQQDIHRYVGALTAFLLVIGLSRLMCYETERNTSGLIGTAAHGPSLTWSAKAGLSILYCVVVVLVLGIVNLGLRSALIGFQDAFMPVSNCVYFESVSLTNITFCAVQYVFLLLGALYFAGFILIIAAISKNTVFTISLCGGSYLASLCYQFVLSSRLESMLGRVGGLIDQICGFIFRFGFFGFMQLESYRWSSIIGWPGQWENVWKPVLFVLSAIIFEFAVLWLLWRHKAKT